jgi:hypothetical protein
MTTTSPHPTPFLTYAAGLGMVLSALQLAPKPALAAPLVAAPIEAGTPGGPTPPSTLSATKAWAATAELYGFLPIRMTGTTTVRGFSADTDLWLGETIPLIQMVGSGRASLEYGRIGMLVDASYTQLGDEASRTTANGLLTGSAQVTAIQGVYDLALRYRFGDPETQAVLPRLKSDLYQLMLDSTRTGGLEGAELEWDERTSVAVVMASAGYPQSSSSGDVISGLDSLPQGVDAVHAGTAFNDSGEVVTAGGRVLAVQAFGEDSRHACFAHTTCAGK